MDDKLDIRVNELLQEIQESFMDYDCINIVGSNDDKSICIYKALRNVLTEHGYFVHDYLPQNNDTNQDNALGHSTATIVLNTDNGNAKFIPNNCTKFWWDNNITLCNIEQIKAITGLKLLLWPGSAIYAEGYNISMTKDELLMALLDDKGIDWDAI